MLGSRQGNADSRAVLLSQGRLRKRMGTRPWSLIATTRVTTSRSSRASNVFSGVDGIDRIERNGTHCAGANQVETLVRLGAAGLPLDASDGVSREPRRLGRTRQRNTALGSRPQINGPPARRPTRQCARPPGGARGCPPGCPPRSATAGLGSGRAGEGNRTPIFGIAAPVFAYFRHPPRAFPPWLRTTRISPQRGRRTRAGALRAPAVAR
jgi:hypothetical protein